MEQDEIERRNKIIANAILRESDLANGYLFDFSHNESLLFGAIAIACNHFNVEWRVSPVDPPDDQAHLFKGRKWFMAKIGGSLSAKYFTMNTASFVALSTFLETQKTIEDGTR